MLKLLFVLLTAVDMVAISAAIEQRSPESASLAMMWLLYYSCLAGWLLGFVAWRDCTRSGETAVGSLTRIFAANSLIFAAVCAILKYGAPDPGEWLGVQLFLVVYIYRLTPLASASVTLTPFMVLAHPKLRTLVAALMCQAFAWFGAWLTLSSEPAWRESFLLFGLWAPNYGFGVMAGGLLLKPLLPRDEPPPGGNDSTFAVGGDR